MEQLVGILAHDSCPIVNLFIDWNPLYADSYTGGYLEENDEHVYRSGGGEGGEPSLWASLVEKAKKVQVLFLRHSGLTDVDLKAICALLKPEAGPLQNKALKVLDISYNHFDAGVLGQEISEVLEVNRSLEYLGLAKNGLTSSHVTPILEHFGRVPFPADQVTAHQAKIKERDAIIEQNKKTKGKKPDVPVPVVDAIEAKTTKDADGNEVVSWFLLKNPQFKHLNLCLN